MNGKRVLRFYFNAAKLDRALDRASLKLALASGGCAGGGERYAQRIISIIEDKSRLSGLWSFLDGVISGLTERDRRALEFYARLRRGTGSLSGETKRELHRAAVKFSRKASRGMEKFTREVALIGRYYALL